MTQEKAKSGNSTKKDVFLLIFCIIGVVLAVLGFMLIRSNHFKLNVFGTKGTVTSIQTASNNGKPVSKSIVLSYNGGKSTYSATVAVDADSEIKMGDEMNLYYDFFTPTSVSTKRSGYIGYLSLILGVILTLKTGPGFLKIIKENYL